MALPIKWTVSPMIAQKFIFAHVPHTGNGRKDQGLDVAQQGKTPVS